MFDAEMPGQLRMARRLARLLDNEFKLFGIRFGLDPIIGLIPGLGDVLPLLFSAYLLALAARLGLPRSALIAMTINSALDVGLGLIPGVGDLSDIFLKANVRNVEIMERHLARKRQGDTIVDGDAWDVR
jgi:hypothetical protein